MLGSAPNAAFAAGPTAGVPARARRRSLYGRSSRFWSFVYAWMVVIQPLEMPKFSWSTLATGARQLVVHDAFDTMACFDGSYVSWLTPMWR